MHLTFLATFPLIFFAYIAGTTLVEKCAALVLAAGFAVIEWTFTSATADRPDGSAALDLVGFSLRRGHTSKEQFWANVLYGPVLLATNGAMPHYFHRMLSVLPSVVMIPLDLPPAPVIQALCFPLTVWLCEIIEGLYLDRIWGKRAWHYTGPYAYIDGHITLDYVWYWIVLGALLNVWPGLIDCAMMPIAESGARLIQQALV